MAIFTWLVKLLLEYAQDLQDTSSLILLAPGHENNLEPVREYEPKTCLKNHEAGWVWKVEAVPFKLEQITSMRQWSLRTVAYLI